MRLAAGGGLRTDGRRRCAALTAALALGAWGCASVRVHGVVDAPDGRPIEGAAVTLRRAGPSGPGAAATTSDERGCFFLFGDVRPGSGTLEVTVEAAGRKGATAVVPAGGLTLLHVTLAGAAGAAESTARAIAAAERPLLYEARCEPPGRPAAIGLH